MKKRNRWISVLALLVVFSLLTGALPTYANAESTSLIRERINALEAEKAGIDADIAELEGQLSENFGQMEEIVAQKDLIDQEVFLLHQQITNLNSQISQYGLLIADKQEELDAAEEHLAQMQAQNVERIRAMEKNGSVSYWSVIFHANSFADLLDRLKMIEEIQQADKARIEEMALAAEAVAEAKESLETEKEALEESKAELEATETKLEAKRAEADSLLAELVAKGEEYEALLETSEAAQADLMQKIANAEAAYEDAKNQQWLASQPPSSSTDHSDTPSPSTNAPSGSGWIVPCSYTYFSSPFGYRTHPLDGVWRMHYGVDLAGPTSTPIYASRSGTVCTASYQEGGAGFYVQIDHGDGYRSIYMHMTHYVVSYGQYVEQGQLIGYMGSTGGSNGPHLHFGISYNGTYVNPADYISI